MLTSWDEERPVMKKYVVQEGTLIRAISKTILEGQHLGDPITTRAIRAEEIQ